MDELPLPLLVVLIVAAVVAGLYLGHRAGKAVPRRDEKGEGKTLGARARSAATGAVVKLWTWNRARKKAERERKA